MVVYVFLFINMDVLLCLNVISKMQEDEEKYLSTNQAKQYANHKIDSQLENNEALDILV